MRDVLNNFKAPSNATATRALRRNSAKLLLRTAASYTKFSARARVCRINLIHAETPMAEIKDSEIFE